MQYEVVSLLTLGSPLATLHARGLYASFDGDLRVLVDTNSTIPGRSETFAGVRPDVVINDGKVAFSGFESLLGGATRPLGVFTVGEEDGEIQLVADTSTAVPDSAGTFSSLSGASMDSNGHIAFVGRLPEGIYARLGGQLVTVMQRGDVINGQIAQNFDLSNDGFDNGQLSVRVRFGSSPGDITSSKLYLITVPEPSTAVVTLAGTSLAALRRRRLLPTA